MELLTLCFSQPNHEYLTQQVKEMRLNEEYAFDNSANTLQIEQRPWKSNCKHSYLKQEFKLPINYRDLFYLLIHNTKSLIRFGFYEFTNLE